jgi:hypothetical protein
LPVTEMVSSPRRMRSSENFVASAGARISICRPFVSCSFRYDSTFRMSSASCARVRSSQNTAGDPVARARFTASFTQSRIAASLVWQARQMSPVSTRCSISTFPAPSTMRTLPSEAISKVLSCEPYSSAFIAISPTFGTLPMVDGSNWPFAWQSSIIAW